MQSQLIENSENLRGLVSVIVIMLFQLIVVFMLVYSKIKKARSAKGQKMQSALREIFPDVTGRKDRFFFRIRGFSSQLNLPKSSLEGMTFYILFSGDLKSGGYSLLGSEKDRIFEVELTERRLSEAEPENVIDLKKHLKIKAEDPALKENLSCNKMLMNALRSLYVEVGVFSQVSLILYKNGVEIYCAVSPKQIYGEKVKKISQCAVKVFEKTLKTAAWEGIQLNAANPFQNDLRSSRSPEPEDGSNENNWTAH